MQGLQELSGREFERIIASLFAELGCQVTHTNVSRDEGIDLVLIVEGNQLVVQCERWKEDVGAPTVRDFFGALMHANAAHGFIVTTARISDSAAAFARGKPITFIDGHTLLKWMNDEYKPSVTGYSPSHVKVVEPAPLDAYAILGIDKGASRKQIKVAYRSLMAQYHPDKVAQLGPELQALATEKCKQISDAYSLLIQGD